MDTVTYVCPVCGYDRLCDLPWQDDSPSDDICPSCGIQFGYHDASGGDTAARDRIHRAWRQRWIELGMPWHSAKAELPPVGWDPAAQLRRLLDMR